MDVLLNPRMESLVLSYFIHCLFSKNHDFGIDKNIKIPAKHIREYTF